MVRLAACVVASVLFASPVLAQTSVASAPSAPQPAVVARTATPPAPAVVPSFGSLFRDLGSDFRHLPSRETAWILGAAGGIGLAVQRQDARVTREATQSLALDRMFEPGELVGGGAAQVGAAFATYAIGRVAKSPRTAAVGADLVRAQILNTVLTQGVKLSVGRTRPDGSRFSFPSGHTSSSFATAAVLQRHFGWRAGVPAYGLAAYIAGSRLQENKHYLSDVVFGAAIGIVAGRTVTIGRGQATFALAPLAAPGGAGVNLTWVGRK